MGNRNVRRGRAWRRDVMDRRIAYATRKWARTTGAYVGASWTWTDGEGNTRTFETEEDLQEYLHQFGKSHADNMTPCSCWMCGNPRKWHGEKTLDEKVADLSENEQRDEEGLPQIASKIKLKTYW